MLQTFLPSGESLFKEQQQECESGTYRSVQTRFDFLFLIDKRRLRLFLRSFKGFLSVRLQINPDSF